MLTGADRQNAVYLPVADNVVHCVISGGIALALAEGKLIICIHSKQMRQIIACRAQTGSWIVRICNVLAFGAEKSIVLVQGFRECVGDLVGQAAGKALVH